MRRERRNRRIFELWLAGWTEREIGDEVGLTHTAVQQLWQEMADLPKLAKPDQSAATHAADFAPPIYNVWKQQTKTNGSNHFGNSEVRWLDNLLYLYTQPFNMVVDPFAGGGSTIDICKKRFRRYFVSDRSQSVGGRGGIVLFELVSRN